jgi:molybdopterin synthase sulfur carrier subunit
MQPAAHQQRPRRDTSGSLNMPCVPFTLPGLLTTCTGGEKVVTVDADTVAGSIDALLRTYPLLKVHLYEENGALRPHVMFLYNDQSIKWLPNLDIPLQEGDKMTVLQLVSGG